MAKFEEYSEKYQHIRLERRDGILQMTFHTRGGSFKAGENTRWETRDAFHNIGDDTENKVVIMTGTGEDFWAGFDRPFPKFKTPAQWEYGSNWEDIKLVMNILDVQAPMIAAVNGPNLIHPQLPLCCDIVLAAESAVFQDSTHFSKGNVPGDGVQVVLPMLLGLNRGRYFLLTGQKLSAREAQKLGLVNEVLSKEDLLPRAWALAEDIAQKPPLTLRYTRVLFTQPLRRQMQDLLGYGMALEGLGFVDAAGMEG